MNSANNSMKTATNSLDFFSTNRLPQIYQAENSECGLACLAMISEYYGHSYDLTHLRGRFKSNAQGASLKDISDFARDLQLMPRAVKLEPEQLNLLQLPCILHWNMSHFVVLASVKKKYCVIHDPALGIRNLTPEEIDASFTGIALELNPTQDFQKKDERRRLQFKDFWTQIIGLKRAAASIILLSFILQILAIISPLFTQIVIDNIVQSQDINLLVVIACGFTILLFLETITGVLRELFIIRVSNKVNIQISSNLFRHLLHLDSEYFSSRNVADIVSRFSSLKNIRDALTTGFVALILDGVMVLLTIIAMFIYDKQLAMISVAMVLIYSTFRTIYFPKTRIRMEESLISRAQENSHFMETVRSIETIKIHAGETKRFFQWQRLLSNALNNEIRLANWDLSFRTFSNFIFSFENILIVAISAIKIIDGEFSIGMFFAFLAFKFRFSTSVNGLITTWFNFKMLNLHLERISDIAFSELNQEKNSHINHSMSEKDEVLDKEKAIEIKDVSFRYHTNKPYLFKKFNITVYRGESVVITGPSGCGKSTLLKIFLNLVNPSSGRITYYSRLGESGRLAKVSAVTQNEQLFSGTIAENIVGFNDDYNLEKIETCGRVACIHDEIVNMPMGYNTLIGDVDHSLSGGQVQRVALARALYSSPDILILDEATSHLDAQNENAINRNLKSLGITCILVAHRLETINSADRKINLMDFKYSI